MKFYGHRYKITRVRTFYVAVIRGESCFEKNAFEDIDNPTPPTKTRLPVKEYLGKYSRYRKKIFVLKLFLRPILFHGKISFDNLTYFKLYGNVEFGGSHATRIINKERFLLTSLWEFLGCFAKCLGCSSAQMILSISWDCLTHHPLYDKLQNKGWKTSFDKNCFFCVGE